MSEEAADILHRVTHKKKRRRLSKVKVRISPVPKEVRDLPYPDVPETQEQIYQQKLWMQAQHASEAEDSKFKVDSVEEWALMTGWHGVLDFFYAKAIAMKFIWAAVLGLCAFLAMNETLSMIMDYTSGSKWVTSISYKEADDGAVQWPNMTISNLNWLGQTGLNQSNITDPHLITYIINADIESVHFYSKYLSDVTENVDEIRNRTEHEYSKYLADHNTTRTEIVAKLAQKCEETVLHCGKSNRFDLQSRTYSCCGSAQASKGRISSFNLNIGNVFGARTSFDPAGYSHGAIYFLLDSKSGDDYANVRMEEKPSNGFNVVLYYGDELDLNSASMMVQPGSHTVVALSAQRFRVGNDPKSIVKWDLGQPPCIRNVDDYPYQHINATDYTVPFCKEDCKARYLASIYNCTCQDLQLRDAAEFCSGSNFSACSEELRRIDEVSKFDRRLIRERRYEDCLNKCLEPCSYDLVGTKISQARFPTDNKIGSWTEYMSRALNGTFTVANAQQMALLEMYFESNQLVVMEKIRRMTVDSLISSIGGSLGVWTGISIISVAQALIYLVLASRQIVRGLVNLILHNTWREQEPVFVHRHKIF